MTEANVVQTIKANKMLIKNAKHIKREILFPIELNFSFAVMHNTSKNPTGINNRALKNADTKTESVKFLQIFGQSVLIQKKVNNAVHKKAIAKPIFDHL